MPGFTDIPSGCFGTSLSKFAIKHVPSNTCSDAERDKWKTFSWDFNTSWQSVKLEYPINSCFTV